MSDSDIFISCFQDLEYFQQMQIPNQNISTYSISWKKDTLSLWELTKLWNEIGEFLNWQDTALLC